MSSEDIQRRLDEGLKRTSTLVLVIGSAALLVISWRRSLSAYDARTQELPVVKLLEGYSKAAGVQPESVVVADTAKRVQMLKAASPLIDEPWFKALPWSEEKVDIVTKAATQRAYLEMAFATAPKYNTAMSERSSMRLVAVAWATAKGSLPGLGLLLAGVAALYVVARWIACGFLGARF